MHNKSSYLSLFAVTLFLSSHPSVQALEASFNDFDIKFDTQLSLGAAWRLEDKDPRQVSRANLGSSPAAALGAPNNNTDDGNWNFDKGETYSKLIKGHSELFVGNDSYGWVAGAKYFYDFEIKDEQRAEDYTGFRRPLNQATKDEAGADVDLMNAYLYGNFDVGGGLSMKVGRQVASWGEGLYIQGGINSINPVDVIAARSPGAQIKDILLPVNMVNTSFAVNDMFSLEAFYQLDWQETVISPCGTFFSVNDAIADDCGPIILVNDPDSDNDDKIENDTAILPRIPDREPSDSGQFGVALRLQLEALNSTELGLYFMNYHSRLPYFSGVVLDPFQLTPSDELPIPGLPSYFREYPEDIRLWGLSLATSLDNGFTLSGEYSFRENQPIQWNANEVISGGVLRLYSRHLQNRVVANDVDDPLELAGEELKGYDRYKVSQLQLSTTKFIKPIFTSDQSLFLAEVGAVYIHGFPDQEGPRYGRSDTLGNGDFAGLDSEVYPDINPFLPVSYSCTGEGALVAVNENARYCDGSGYTSKFSWGYVLSMMLEYQSVYKDLNIKPEVFFSHDVKGYSPKPLEQFVEGRKTLGLTLNTDFNLNRYQSSLSYVRYFGGSVHNNYSDRDHVVASVSVSF